MIDLPLTSVTVTFRTSLEAPAESLPVGCRSAACRQPVGCRSTAPQLPLDNPSAAARQPLGCPSAKVLVFKPLGPFGPEIS